MEKTETALDEVNEGKRATVHDVARTAGVSLATVDRVLNARPGVRPETAEKVESAIKALDFRRDLSASLLARARDLRITFLIPDGGNAFMASLGDAVARRTRQTRNERLTLTVATYHALDSGALPPEDGGGPKAITKAARRGVAVITLVSDLPGSARRHFIGIDNQAAGR